MENEYNKSTFFSGMKELLSRYIDDRVELTRLSIYEKTSKVSAALFTGMLLMILFMGALLFLSFMAAYYFSEKLGSYYAGFGVVAGMYLLLFLLLLVFRKGLVENRIINLVLGLLMDEKKKEND